MHEFFFGNMRLAVWSGVVGWSFGGKGHYGATIFTNSLLFRGFYLEAWKDIEAQEFLREILWTEIEPNDFPLVNTFVS